MRFADKTNVFLFFFPPVTFLRPDRRRAARAFIETEAMQEGFVESDSSEQDEEPTAEDCQFIAPDDDDQTEVSTPSEHRRLDALEMERQAETIMPYFPRALAVSDDRPLQFNFNLFLLDSLTLPRDIVARDSEEPTPPHAVEFTTVAGAISYCKERLEYGWRNRQSANSQPERPQMSSARLSHPDVDKWALFRSDGRRLSKSLQSGEPALDENLNKVRLDR